MSANELVPSLMFMTLIATLLIAVGAFAYFLRKRRNRELAVRAFEGDAGKPPIDSAGATRSRVVDSPERERV
jgi:NADH:ubiquinone oxidoreductase subunit 3 (subunit A)